MWLRPTPTPLTNGRCHQHTRIMEKGLRWTMVGWWRPGTATNENGTKSVQSHNISQESTAREMDWIHSMAAGASEDEPWQAPGDPVGKEGRSLKLYR